MACLPDLESLEYMRCGKGGRRTRGLERRKALLFYIQRTTYVFLLSARVDASTIAKQIMGLSEYIFKY